MIIDFHTHAFPDQIAERAVGKLAAIANLEPQHDGTVSDLLRKMEKSGVDASVILNIATNPKQMTNVNNFAIDTLEKYKGKSAKGKVAWGPNLEEI